MNVLTDYLTLRIIKPCNSVGRGVSESAMTKTVWPCRGQNEKRYSPDEEVGTMQSR